MSFPSGHRPGPGRPGLSLWEGSRERRRIQRRVRRMRNKRSSRQSPRCALRRVVAYQSAGRHANGVIYNLSAKGALVGEVSHRLALGTRLQLLVDLAPDWPRLSIGAQVVRETPTGFAVQFDRLEGRLKQLIRSLVPRAERQTALRCWTPGGRSARSADLVEP